MDNHPSRIVSDRQLAGLIPDPGILAPIALRH